ncbi:MAG: DUF3575 domain-containing protein [Prevotellaceae bacterium]|jgi:hypothetical protein|nr:DUF3575 domain-containing protein [Prevotellaceae bacterium]
MIAIIKTIAGSRFIVYILLVFFNLAIVKPNGYAAPDSFIKYFVNEDSLFFKTDTLTEISNTLANPAVSLMYDRTGLVQSDSIDSSIPEPKYTHWSVKTNVLYVLLITPNIEGEYLWNKRYSLNVEAQYAKWSVSSGAKNYALWSVSPEMRYWLQADGNYTGHYLGMYGHVGQYDIKLSKNRDKNGTQGDIWGLGFSYGYVFDINNHFGTTDMVYLELGLAIGYVYSPYKEYTKVESYFCEVNSGYKNYIGPTKIKASLIFKFGNNR